MNKLSLAFVITLFAMPASASPKFGIQASYINAALNTVNFDYSAAARQTPPGFSADGKFIPGSACYAKISGEDNDTLTDFMSALTDKQLYALIADARKRMQEGVARQKLEIWQEVLCVVEGKENIPYRETSKDSKGKWDSAAISIDGVRKGSWKEVFTVVRRKYLYSITVTPARQADQP
jgi:hypothetical protein